MSPLMSPTLSLTDEILVIMSIMAPQNPSMTPPTFFPDKGSFRMMAERNIANIGMDVVTILVSTTR